MNRNYRFLVSALPLTALLAACPGELERGDDVMDEASTTADASTTAGLTGDLCTDYCNHQQGCNPDTDLDECVAECTALRGVREAYYAPDCLAATDAQLTCAASASCEYTDTSCDALAFTEQSTCISGAQPSPAVAEICQLSMDCLYGDGSGYGPEECPQEYLDDPYYAFYCEITLYDYCVYDFIETYVVETHRHGCVEEFEALLTCFAPLECYDDVVDETPLCTAEAEALETACPDLGAYYDYDYDD